MALGQALRGVATAALDVSDGLLGDLGHILKSSHVGATVNVDSATSLISSYADCKRAGDQFGTEIGIDQWRRWALAGGDDYELLFTATPDRRDAVAAAALSSNTPVMRIGRIDAEPGLRLIDAQGQTVANTFASFDHFR